MNVGHNTVRFDPRSLDGHVESHFLKANSRGGKRAIWIRHTIHSPKGKPEAATAEVWAVAFQRDTPSFPKAVKATIPASEARFRDRPFRLEHDHGVLQTGRARGFIDGTQDHASGRHTVQWALDFEPRGDAYEPYGIVDDALAAMPRFAQKLLPGRYRRVSTYPNTWLRGAVEVDGERWVIDGWNGMQGHGWGVTHGAPTVRAHCNAWDTGRDDAWFELVATRVPIGKFDSPWLTSIALHIDGRLHTFGGAAGLLAEIDQAPGRLRFRTRGGSLSGILHTTPGEVACLRERDPNGALLHSVTTKLADARLMFNPPGREAIELRTRRMGLHLETREMQHGLRVQI